MLDTEEGEVSDDLGWLSINMTIIVESMHTIGSYHMPNETSSAPNASESNQIRVRQ